MLSNTSRYAIRAMIYLALNASESNKIGIKKIAEELDIPSPFLGKILQQLTRHKLLVSTKGPHGGFALPNENEHITLYDVIITIDGKDLFEGCLISFKSCAEEGSLCPLHNQYERIRSQLIDMFKYQSISEMAENIRNSNMNIEI